MRQPDEIAENKLTRIHSVDLQGKHLYSLYSLTLMGIKNSMVVIPQPMFGTADLIVKELIQSYNRQNADNPLNGYTHRYEGVIIYRDVPDAQQVRYTGLMFDFLES